MDTTDKLDEIAGSFGITLSTTTPDEALALALAHLAAVHADRPTPCRYCGPDSVKLLAEADEALAAGREYRLVGGDTLTPRAEIPHRRDWATCSLPGCGERLHPNERLPHVNGAPYCGDLDAATAQRAQR